MEHILSLAIEMESITWILISVHCDYCTVHCTHAYLLSSGCFNLELGLIVHHLQIFFLPFYHREQDPFSKDIENMKFMHKCCTEHMGWGLYQTESVEEGKQESAMWKSVKCNVERSKLVQKIKKPLWPSNSVVVTTRSLLP